MDLFINIKCLVAFTKVKAFYSVSIFAGFYLRAQEMAKVLL